MLEASGVNYQLKPEGEQEAILASFRRFLNGLDHPLQVLVRVVPADVEGYLAGLGEAGPGTETLTRLRRDHEAFVRRIARERTLLDRRFHVVVPAGVDGARSPGPPAWRDLLRPRRRVAAAGGRNADLRGRGARSPSAAARWSGAWARSAWPAGGCAARSWRRSGGPRWAAARRARPAASRRPPRRSPCTRGRDGRPPVRSALTLLPGRDRGSVAAAGERRFALGERSPADLVAPGAVEEARDHLAVDDRLTRVLALTDYPRHVSPDWLGRLMNQGVPLDLSLHLDPLDSGDAVRALSHRMVELQSSRLLDARGGRIASAEREVAYEDAERLRDALERGDERVFSAGLYLRVHGRTAQELDRAAAGVEGALSGMMARRARRSTR